MVPPSKRAAKPSDQSRRQDAPRSINLALQGGGSHGAFTWGVLDRLLEDGRVTFDGICGTSAGAMNAVLVAHGLMHGGSEGARASLANFWGRVGQMGAMLNPGAALLAGNPIANSGSDPILATQQWAIESFTRTFSPYQFNPLNVNPLRDLLAGCVDFDALHHCDHVKLFLCATNVRSGKVRIFDNAAMSVDAVMASACLPHLFHAVEIDGEHYWDGGYMGNPVLYPLFYQTATRDVVVVMVNQMWRDEVPTTSAGIEDRLNEISFNSSLMREMRAVEFVSRQLTEGWLKPEYAKRMRHILVHLIRADAFMGTLSAASKISTDTHFLASLRDLGRASAEQWLNAHHADLGRRSTVDLRREFLD
ncbi:MAG TPA: patatin-like phospholipase family protein [Dokdonella sp.]|uniref:patatin-like phospholipase family protein n=1 Tax=Dokdonella sp. TaxID=2291710 RepID=UPI002CDF5F26|nr:patatin-like phospholipase family protein [Dokdonella sp.]HOX70664.1 patatin-like phospholipase family protein [Dokdonella sp.]